MKKFLQTLFSLFIILLAWQVLSHLIHKTIIIPSPIETLPLVVKSLSSRDMLIAVGQTVWKVILVLILSILVGLPAGLLLGKSSFLYQLFRPWIMIIQSVPVISWITLVVFVWGIGWKGPVFIATLSLLPMSILTTISGVHHLDNNLTEMAHFYQVPTRRIIKDVYLGALFPFTMAILDVNIGQAWKIILVTEYLCGGNGLGEKILMARMNIDIPGVWALTLIAIGLGISTEVLSKQILKGAFKNYGDMSQGNSPFKIV